MTTTKRPTLKLPKIPSKEQVLMSAQNTDKVPAMIHNPQGQPMGAAALTHGEFVFSIPSIIALGKGNYHKGLGLLKQVHTELKKEGEKLMGFKQGGAGLRDGLPSGPAAQASLNNALPPR